MSIDSINLSNILFKIIFLYIVFSITIVSCSDKGTNSNFDSNLLYSGITETNTAGQILSEDPDDWYCIDTITYYDTTFIIDTVTLTDTIGVVVNPITMTYGVYPAYPNPATHNQATIEISLPFTGKTHNVTIRIANNSGFDSIVFDRGGFGAGNHSFVWDCTDVEPGIYRCFVSTDDWKCYGDIQVK